MAGRGIDGQKIRKIRRSIARQAVVAESGKFVFDARVDREPVEGSQMRRNVFSSWDSENKTSSIVLDLLQFVQERLRTAEKKRVAVV